MPKKQVVFTPATDVAAAQNLVKFTLDLPKDAPEGTQAEVIVFDLSKLTQETILRLALHGASQKIGDSYAGAKESGEDPLKYTKEAIEATIKQLEAGDWSVTRTGSGAPRVSILVLALAKVKGITQDEALELVGDLSEDDKKELQKNKKIAAAMAGIRAEQALARAKKAEEAALAEDAEKTEAQA